MAEKISQVKILEILGWALFFTLIYRLMYLQGYLDAMDEVLELIKEQDAKTKSTKNTDGLPEKSNEQVSGDSTDQERTNEQSIHAEPSV